MNKIVRIVAIVLCVLTALGTVAPMVINAEELQETNYKQVLVEQNDDNITLVDNEVVNETSQSELEETWNGKCEVNVILDSQVTEKTDNIVVQFTPKGSLISANSVTLSREQDFKGVVELVPDEYKISVLRADNKYEVILKENFAKVPEAKKIDLTLTAKKIQNGGFVASFFRNNTFLLILLAASSITYYILRKRRLENVYDTSQRD
jgi:hypothetical protein